MLMRLTVGVAVVLPSAAFEILLDQIAELEEFDLPLCQVSDASRFDELVAVLVEAGIM